MDRKVKQTFAYQTNDEHVICDIDKTYLETDFESLRQLAKIPFEAASDKVTVQGADYILSALRWTRDGDSFIARPLHFVSSSPPQLRQTLRDKFYLDRISWSTDTFKNQVYNLFPGRTDQLRQHILYKSVAISQLMIAANRGSTFVFIGDSSESDPLIYLGLKFLIEGVFDIERYSEYLELNRVVGSIKDKFCEELSEHIEQITSLKTKGVFIRSLKNYPLSVPKELSTCLASFDHYWELGLHLYSQQLITLNQLKRVAILFHNKLGFPVEILADFYQSHMGDSSPIKMMSELLDAMDQHSPQPLPQNKLEALKQTTVADIYRTVAQVK